MRPKKRILVFATNEEAGLCLVHVLATRGYHPRLVHTPEDWTAQFDSFRPDVALMLYRGEGRPMMEAASRQSEERNVPVLVALMHRKLTWDMLVSSVVTDRGDHTFMAELVERLRICCARKRGPKRVDSLSHERVVAAAQTASAANVRWA